MISDLSEFIPMLRGETKTEPAFPNRELATETDIPVSRVKTTQKMRARTAEVTGGFLREREVTNMLCDSEHLSRDRLVTTRKSYSGGKMTFAEFMFKGSGDVYLYVTPEDPTADYTTPDRSNRPKVAHPGVTALLKVDHRGIMTEVYRWND